MAVQMAILTGAVLTLLDGQRICCSIVGSRPAAVTTAAQAQHFSDACRVVLRDNAQQSNELRRRKAESQQNTPKHSLTMALWLKRRFQLIRKCVEHQKLAT